MEFRGSKNVIKLKFAWSVDLSIIHKEINKLF